MKTNEPKNEPTSQPEEQRHGVDPDLERRVSSALEESAERVRRIAADLHRTPEVGGAELHSVTRLVGELEEESFEVETGLAGLPTSFRARFGDASPRTRIALLAEYDAIPGLGHACGHNLLCAASYGAAIALSRVTRELGAEIAVVGAPAEETFGGKVVLARQGVFEDTDVALLAHPGDADHAIVQSNASWSFEVCFEGRSAHAVASPESGVNALDAMVQLFIGRDVLLKALGTGVSMPGVILEGGVRPNVIPDRARAHFSLRASSSEMLVSKVVARFRDLVEGVARATGVGVRMESIDNLYDELVPNPVLAEIWVRRARESGSPCELKGTRPIGSLDVGTLSWHVPTLHPFFSIVESSTPTHTRAFTRAAIEQPALDATVRAARTLALTALEVIASPRTLERVRAAHEPPAAEERASVEAPLVTRGLEP